MSLKFLFASFAVATLLSATGAPRASTALGAPAGQILEFRAGDRLPMSWLMEGDLLESQNPEQVYLTVKRPFWIRYTETVLELSLDGKTYRPILEALTGTVTAGATTEKDSPVVNGLQLSLKYGLK